MEALYTILATVVALGLLVTVHELGHFWMARRCGVRVLRFSVGFGLPLLRWHDAQGTEFVIAAIPLGGYVRMLDEREGPVPETALNEAFNRKTVWQRFGIVAAGPLVNFGLALVLFWVLSLLGSQQVKPVVGVVETGSLAEQAGLQEGSEILAVDGHETRSWREVNLRLVSRLGESGLLTFQVRPQDTNVEQIQTVSLQDWLKHQEDPDPLAELGIIPWRPKVEAKLAELDDQGPAKAAGLRMGDRLLSLNQQPIEDWYSFVERIQSAPNQVIHVQILRDGGQRLDFTLTLGVRVLNDKSVGYFGAGVAPAQWPEEMLRMQTFGPVDGLLEAVQRTWSMSVLTLDSLKKMLLGELSVKNLSGPITIAKVAGASAQSSLRDFLNFLAYLSISLGVLNLLPIPVLDGGHLVFYLIEWVRGRPLSERVQGWSLQVGISLMIGVMLLALFNDIGRL